MVGGPRSRSAQSLSGSSPMSDSALAAGARAEYQSLDERSSVKHVQPAHRQPSSPGQALCIEARIGGSGGTAVRPRWAGATATGERAREPGGGAPGSAGRTRGCAGRAARTRRPTRPRSGPPAARRRAAPGSRARRPVPNVTRARWSSARGTQVMLSARTEGVRQSPYPSTATSVTSWSGAVCTRSPSCRPGSRAPGSSAAPTPARRHGAASRTSPQPRPLQARVPRSLRIWGDTPQHGSQQEHMQQLRPRRSERVLLDTGQ